MGFVGWLKHQVRRDDAIGEFARWWTTDACRPRGGVGEQSVTLHLQERHAERAEVGATAFDEYMAEEQGPARSNRGAPRKRTL